MLGANRDLAVVRFPLHTLARCNWFGSTLQAPFLVRLVLELAAAGQPWLGRTPRMCRNIWKVSAKFIALGVTPSAEGALIPRVWLIDPVGELESHSCSICYELMEPPDRSPILLFPCGHTLCKACLNQHQATAKAKTCALCRAPIKSQ
jgi:hypothetical protein